MLFFVWFGVVLNFCLFVCRFIHTINKLKNMQGKREKHKNRVQNATYICSITHKHFHSCFMYIYYICCICWCSLKRTKERNLDCGCLLLLQRTLKWKFQIETDVENSIKNPRRFLNEGFWVRCTLKWLYWWILKVFSRILIDSIKEISLILWFCQLSNLI